MKTKKDAKRVRRARVTRKPEAPPIKTMQDLVAALGGAQHIVTHTCALQDELLEWFRLGYVRRGYDLPVVLSLMQRGYELDRINPKLFGWATWSKYTIPVRR